MSRGEQAAAAGRLTEAARDWTQGVKADPTFPDCYERLGDLYRQNHDGPAAVAVYAAAARLQPGDGPLWKKLADAQRAAGDDSGALQSAQTAYRLLPGDADAAATYGMLAAKRYQWAEALTALQRAHRLAPTDGRILMDLAGLEIDLRDLDAAERDLDAAPGAGSDPRWCYMMAQVDTLRPRTPERLQAAIGYAELSVASGRAVPQVYLLLGELYLDAGRLHDTLHIAQMVLQRYPNNSEALSQLVTCEMRLGRPDLAAPAAARLRAATAQQDRIERLKPPSVL